MKTKRREQERSALQDVNELPPFHAAARQGNTNELCQLLQIHPDLIDYADSRGYTALMYAVFSKNLPCLNILLKAGCKTEITDGMGRTALLFCTRKGWSDGCEAVLSFGASCNTIDGNSRNAIHFSACNNKPKCLEIVLKHASLSDINHKDVEGMTPLHWAAFHNLHQNIALLLENCADSSLLDYEGKNPLHWAAQNGCSAACSVLLSSSSSKTIINQKNDGGKTPLHFAAAAGNLEVIFELSQSFGCDLDIGDNEGRTALHWACALGECRCVAGLLRLGVYHSPLDKYNITPLGYAKQLNHLKCVTLLENYNPAKPQDILIPFQSMQGNSNGIDQEEKRISLSSSSSSSSLSSSFSSSSVSTTPSTDIPDSEIFSLNMSNAKEKRQIENMSFLHSRISCKASENDAFNHIVSEIFDDDSVANNSRVQESNHSSNSSQAPLITSDCSSDISEDEQRYQTQMAISPPINSVTSSPDFLDRPKDFNTADIGLNLRSPRLSHTHYTLAPVRDRKMQPNRSRKTSDAVAQSFDNRKLIPDDARRKKISAVGFNQSRSMNDAVLKTKDGNFHTGAKISNVGHPGLRRKSISMNDGLNLLEKKKSTELPLVRTQSFGIIRQPHRKLPIIEAGDGRNLTQLANRKFTEIDEGYEGLDERSQMSAKELDFGKRKRRIKKKHKLSKHNFLFGDTSKTQ